MAGEIVEVQGGHIVRSTGRKDRHSKVCTAKGPRDRRVRLSAHTAIQFYDVQDRLGYDRPSKAVDWLIKKAKAAIDQLDRLPPWNPTAVASSAAAECGILPPSLDSDAIADTIKSFFPVAASASARTGEEEQQQQQQNPHSHSHFPVPQFHDYSSHPSQSQQDLRLSLQSFNDEDPILLHHQNAMAFGWAEQHQPSQRIAFGGGGGGSEGGRFVFNSLHGGDAVVQPFFGRAESGQFLFSSQRGPLQSSNTPSVRASWIEAPSMPAMPDHHHHHPISQAIHNHNGGISMNFGGGFSGFHHIPARIQGDEEHNGGGDKPSSASSDSRH